MKVEEKLILHKYFLSLFGVESPKKLFDVMRDAKEGVDSDGYSYFVKRILSSSLNLKISEEDLYRYDKNVQEYVKSISERRGFLNLKYFQYLAVLFTEIFLDRYKNKKQEFLMELGEEFLEKDIRKLAYWMATGSGKTIIMHINYLQFLRYEPFKPNNIILITPNEGLSVQHLEELEKSGIPAKRYEGNSSINTKDGEILIIEITKLTEERGRGGKSISLDTFEGQNLLFVDEGHKGKKSEEKKWAKIREELAKDGFTFEYSATFGQILDDEETLKEYSKSIIFDYSYKYFYLDGYGKDFWVYTVKEPSKFSDKEFINRAFVSNLLDFYQQLKLYEEKKDLVRKYNIEKPLWIFVGATVSGKGVDSDIVEILRLIKNLQNQDFLKEKIDVILNDKTFEGKFEYIRSKLDLEDLYKKVFNGRGSLRIIKIKNADGEYGLKFGENEYFGVVNVGKSSEFEKLLEKAGFEIEEDVISDSLFYKIKSENSPINILIGSRKFIEGWDTWRVSCMGLLNIGKGEGPQIIQLFGRGVRLKGENFSLKRSENPEIKSLETLNVYGIKADYITKFLEAIKKEEVELERIKIPVCVMPKERWEKLDYLVKDENKKFEREKIIFLSKDDKTYYTMDLTGKVAIYSSEESDGQRDIQTKQQKESEGVKVLEKINADYLDWNHIYAKMKEFKIERGYWNLYFDVESLKEVLENCRIKIDEDREDKLFEISSKEDLSRLNELVLSLLKGYTDKFYKKQKGMFEKNFLKIGRAGEQLSLFNRLASEGDGYYTVEVRKDKQKLIEKIKRIAENIDELLKDDNKDLKRISLDFSIFTPLLLKNEEVEKITPPALVESEERFVRKLKEYVEKERKGKLKGCEIYLLRNEVRSGIGFRLEWAEFYPDFILWIKREGKTFMVFVEPKGLIHIKGLDDEKVRFVSEELKDLINDPNIVLKGFILSATKYEDLIRGYKDPPKKEEYENKNILFRR